MRSSKLKIILSVLSIIFVFVVFPSQKSFADTIASGNCGNGLKWFLDDEGNLRISGSGMMTNWSSTSDVPWDNYRSSVKTVSISNNVTSIGGYAFYDCKSLQSFNIPSTVTSIGELAFAKCTNLSGELRLPSGLTELGGAAFSGCSKLTGTWNLPSGLTSMGNNVFALCSGITGEVVIPEGITELGQGVFSRCSGISKVTIHAGVKKLEDQVFKDCTGITELTIPGNINYKYDSTHPYAFTGCTAISKIYIIGKGAMTDYSSDTEPSYLYTPWHTTEAEFTVNIAEGITKIGDWTFYNCANLKSVNIPSTVTSIGELAFAKCTVLSKVKLPYKTTSIGASAFSSCTGLTSVVLNENAYSDSAFAGVSSRILHYFYNVTYSNDNNGTVSGKTLTYGTDAIELSISPKENYALDKVTWISGSETVVLKLGSDGKYTMPDSKDDVEIKATFVRDVYYVSFVDGKSTYSTVTVKTNGKVSRPTTNPTKDGYLFEDWYSDSDLNTKFDFDNTTISSDISIYAKWNLVTYTISYDLNGGTVSKPNPESYTIESADISLTNPTKDGYGFIGWNGTGLSGTFKNIVILNGSTGNRTYTAVWGCKVTFETNGGSKVPDQVVAFEGKATKPADNPTKDGYRFDNWYLDSGYTTKFDFANTKIKKNTTIYAKYNQEFSITVSSGTSDKQKAIKGETVTITANKAKEGEEFDKWTALSDTISFTSETSTKTTFKMPSSDVEVKAEFIKGHHLVHKDAEVPTCTKDGHEEYYECSRCHEKFSDKDGKNKIDEIPIVKKLGHDPNPVRVKRATRDKDGCKGHYVCNRCGKKFWDKSCKRPADDKDLIIPAIGAAKLNEKATIEGLIYQVTNPSTNGSGTVSLIGVKQQAENVTIPATVVIKETTYKVESIVAEAFKGNTTLKSVVIGENVLTIDSKAFYGCSSLTSVTGGDNLVTIGTSAFAGCKKLKTFKITSPVLAKIGSSAFSGDKKLKTIYIKNTTKLTKSGVKKSLKGSKVKTVKVKKSKVKKYKKYFKKKNSGRTVKVKK